MKKRVTSILAGLLSLTLLAGCSNSGSGGSSSGGGTTAGGTTAAPKTSAAAEATTAAPAAPTGGSVKLQVTTTYGGTDGGRDAYEAAIGAWQEATGNTVLDASDTSDETFKAKVQSDFEAGSEPDVLFYFIGSDANKIVQNSKVVPITEIQGQYPDYASAHDMNLIPASPVDGVQYAIPAYGYWELMFVNKNVVEEAGATIPDANTTWEGFMDICQTISDANLTPIAVSVHGVPHYWFEFTVLSHTGLLDHQTVPTSATDEIGQKWVAGLNDIKTLYERGFLPSTTTTSTDDEVWDLFYSDKAAFAIDGSWKVGNIEANVDDISRITATYVPTSGTARKTSDIVGGLSSGWYITRKAWDDPEKQAAAVDLINYMTSADVIATFSTGSTVSLKSGAIAPENPSSLLVDCLAAVNGRNGIAPATQDGLTSTQREALFADVKNIVTGNISAEDALANALSIA